MKFLWEFDESCISMSRLIYDVCDYAFCGEPARADGFTSVVLNDLIFELDTNRRVIEVWGFCPYFSWVSKKLEPPIANWGRVKVSSTVQLKPGVSIDVAPGCRWPIFVDPRSGWVLISGESSKNLFTSDLVSVSILDGVIFTIDRAGVLHSLWLHPTELPNLEGK